MATTTEAPWAGDRPPAGALEHLMLVLEGRTYRQVAAELGLPPQAVAREIRATMQHILGIARAHASEGPLPDTRFTR